MLTHAFIFARGGSKGLPGKNIRPLAGKPLLAYAIETAQGVAAIDRVFVSTDGDAIAAVAREYGATVIPRPAELATDTAPELLAWQHAIEWVTRQYGKFDGFVSLPATAPLRLPEDVNNALLALETAKADLCVSMTPAQRSPYFNMVRRTDDNLIDIAIKPEGQVSRRQDAPTLYDLTTVVYATSPGYVRQVTQLFAGKVTSIEVPKARAVDIDDEVDFMLAEVLMKKRQDGAC